MSSKATHEYYTSHYAFVLKKCHLQLPLLFTVERRQKMRAVAANNETIIATQQLEQEKCVNRLEHYKLHVQRETGDSVVNK